MGIEQVLYRTSRQPLVYWEYEGIDAYGNKQFKTPIQIYGRFESMEKVEMNDAGEMDTVDSKIFVLEDVVKNGYLYLGELSEVISISTPLKIEKACRIISFSKIPSLNKTNEFIRIAYSKTNIGNESGF